MTSQRIERTWIRTGGSGANGLSIIALFVVFTIILYVHAMMIQFYTWIIFYFPLKNGIKDKFEQISSCDFCTCRIQQLKYGMLSLVS